MHVNPGRLKSNEQQAPSTRLVDPKYDAASWLFMRVGGEAAVQVVRRLRLVGGVLVWFIVRSFRDFSLGTPLKSLSRWPVWLQGTTLRALRAPPKKGG